MLRCDFDLFVQVVTFAFRRLSRTCMHLWRVPGVCERRGAPPAFCQAIALLSKRLQHLVILLVSCWVMQVPVPLDRRVSRGDRAAAEGHVHQLQKAGAAEAKGPARLVAPLKDL
mgnify:CR=1 FL=1